MRSSRAWPERLATERGDVVVAAAVLAAGRGSRFARRKHKLTARIGGRPLVAWAIDAAIGSGLAPILVVVGRRGRRVAHLVPPGVEVVRSWRWRRGIAHSLCAALTALESADGVDAVCIGLADQPLVGSRSYGRLARAHAEGALLAVATYDGQRANPVLIDRSLWPAARALRGDAGARMLMTEYPVTEVDCTDTGAPTDVDTLEDLRAIERAGEWKRVEKGKKDRDADH